MGYSEDESMVRVDFFKPSGKWYCTEAVKWAVGCWKGDSDNLIHEAFAKSLHDHLVRTDNGSLARGAYRLSDMVAVCLEPYHEHAHPISLEVSRVHELLLGDRERYQILDRRSL